MSLNPPSDSSLSSPPSLVADSRSDRSEGLAEFFLFGGRISDYSFIPLALPLQHTLQTDDKLKSRGSGSQSSGTQVERPNVERSGPSRSSRSIRESYVKVFPGRFPFPRSTAPPLFRSDSEASLNVTINPKRPGVARSGSRFDSATTSGAEGDLDEDSDGGSDGGLVDAVLQSQLRKMLQRTARSRPIVLNPGDRAAPISERQRSASPLAPNIIPLVANPPSASLLVLS